MKYKYTFPYGRIEKGETVVIVGGGTVGKSFVDQIQNNDYCEIAGIVDKAYKYKKEINGIQVSSYEELKNIQCDHIIIATIPENWPSVLKDLLYVDVPLSKCVMDIYKNLVELLIPVSISNESYSFVIRAQEDFFEKYRYLRDRYGAFEQKIIEKVKNSVLKEIEIEGFCSVCGKTSRFDLNLTWGGDIHFRERMICPKCHLNMRMRCAASWLLDHYTGSEKIYVYERVTNWYKAIVEKIGNENITGSEYFGEPYRSGDVIDEILHEDATQLSFPDESFDIIVSNDVFEHVTDYRAAFIESNRVLKSSGIMFLSIPFDVMKKRTEIRAKIVDGEIVYLKTPVYHGNPIDSKGSLVFTDFGWDILDIVKECGFSDIRMILCYDIEKGYLNPGTYYFELVK